jgi:hypothetical protein
MRLAEKLDWKWLIVTGPTKCDIFEHISAYTYSDTPCIISVVRPAPHSAVAPRYEAVWGSADTALYIF